MSIEIVTKNPLVKFSSLMIGDLFRYKEITYMKIKDIDIGSKDYYERKEYILNAVDMKGGIARILEGSIVESIKAELHIL